jgi:hypothetical protein
VAAWAQVLRLGKPGDPSAQAQADAFTAAALALAGNWTTLGVDSSGMR